MEKCLYLCFMPPSFCGNRAIILKTRCFFFFWQVERMQGNSQLMIFIVQFLILIYFKCSELMSTFSQNLIYIPCSRENCLIICCFFFSSTPQSIFLKTQRRSQFYLYILLKMQILLESEIKLVWRGIQESVSNKHPKELITVLIPNRQVL